MAKGMRIDVVTTCSECGFEMGQEYLEDNPSGPEQINTVQGDWYWCCKNQTCLNAELIY